MTHRHATQQGAHLALPQRDYPHGTRARYVGQKCRCDDCREANRLYAAKRARNPRICADAARNHIQALQAKNVGLRSIADVADVPRVALKRICDGQPTVLRSIANRILSVDESIIADGAHVPSAETRRLLRELVREGWSRPKLARMLGLSYASVFVSRRSVLASTALKVRKLHAELTAESDERVPRVSLRERLLAGVGRFDAVRARDLFDALGIDEEDRDAAEQALHRLWKDGAIRRLGSGKPYRYAPLAEAVIRAQVL